jgi:hypothetical protein
VTDDEIKKLARETVAETLRSLGLDPSSPDTVADIHDLKGLLGAWRGAKRTIGQTVTRVITVAILGALALGAAMQIRGGGSE